MLVVIVTLPSASMRHWEAAKTAVASLSAGAAATLSLYLRASPFPLRYCGFPDSGLSRKELFTSVLHDSATEEPPVFVILNTTSCGLLRVDVISILTPDPDFVLSDTTVVLVS